MREKPYDVVFSQQRRRDFCSVHPWAANTTTQWATSTKLFVATRGWAKWRNLTAHMFPSANADYFDDLLFIYTARGVGL